MKLVKDAKRIAARAHSMWAFYLSLVCLAAPDAIYLIWERDTNPRLWWVAAFVLIVYGIWGRLKDQGITHSPAVVALMAFLMAAGTPEPPKPAQGTTEAATMAVAVPLVAKWEGKRNHAYLDRIASPPIWTICHGETRGVKQGDFKTDAECDAMLKRGLITYRTGLHGYFSPETKQRRLTPERDAAYVSLAYNVGVHGAGRSTATRRLNAGNIAGGCEAITWWNRAGQRVVRGLVRRRADEYRLCMQGLAA